MPEQNYLEKLSANIQDAYARYTNNDHKAISTSRDALEIILDSIYDIDKITVPLKRDGYSSPYLKINKLGKLKDSNNNFIYEEFIVYEMHIVRVFGNMVNHSSKFQTSKKDQYVVFNYLLRITVWYCERYGLTKYHVYTEAKKYLENFEGAEEQSSASTNEQYLSDLKLLDNNNDNYISSLLNNKTILIVIGTHILPELLDRPLAELLRNKIHETSSLRAIIISDLYYKSEEEMHSLPVISIGGSEINSLTWEIKNIGKTRNPNRGVFEADRWINNINQIALWGESANGTKRSVENFIKKEDGLKQLLSYLG